MLVYQRVNKVIPTHDSAELLDPNPWHAITEVPGRFSVCEAQGLQHSEHLSAQVQRGTAATALDGFQEEDFGLGWDGENHSAEKFHHHLDPPQHNP